MAKVLIVLDGGYRFTPAGTPAGTTDFTYVTLVEALTSAGHQVTKAHRQSDSSADHQSFNFATTLNLLNFDVLWLIGLDGRNQSGTTTKLPDDQLNAIARFMDAGGGVFATGDHDSIGANMSGHILRVRAMRSWFGAGDPVSPMPADFPRNFPPTGADTLGQDRAETGRFNPAGDYDLNNDGSNDGFIWFENQSDSVPQAIAPLTPTHPILQREDGTAIEVYPDHMHEGQTLGEVTGYPYTTASATFDGQVFSEFPEVAGERPLPQVIATGQSVALSSRFAFNNSTLDSHVATAKTINTLSAYDGRKAGVGRVVTGSTFHHYVDINLTGDSRMTTPAQFALAGADTAKGHGFNDNPAVFADIKRVYANIATWLARPRPRIQLILERSTFSQAEAQADSNFNGAILVTVDGLKPNQFPGGGITTLSPSAAQLASWAPALTALEPAGLTLTPTAVASDDPTLSNRLQRITFTYRVSINAGAAFGFSGDVNHITIEAALSSPAAANPLADSAQITLTKSANPFMLDLAGGNDTPWLSSDVRVFPLVAGAPGSPLPNNATRQQALDHLTSLLSSMTVAQFEALETAQAASALSPLATTTGSPARKVYNFAIARVRLPSAGASANNVRVFFRIFTSQTTAALTYSEAPPGTPIQGYRKTAGGSPIALPGTNSAGTGWLSFPMFAVPRAGTPETQTDAPNVRSINPGNSTFFGCLIDNNLPDPYLPLTPGGAGAAQPLPTLMMGEHQCIVAQIEFPGTPIPNGANPFTSDKLSQRNIALSSVANPGLDASRHAFHTFEIEAAPQAVSEALLPDELLLEWLGAVPEGTEVRLFLPSWDAEAVVALANRFYPRHEIRVLDAHTVALPGGGLRFVPLPPTHQRQTGIIGVHFPLGIKKGERFDLAVRQISNRGRRAPVPPPRVRQITPEEAARLLAQIERPRGKDDTGNAADDKGLPLGVFELGDNRVLVTDLRALDSDGDQPLLIQYPEPEKVAEIRRREGGRWRETIGAFQLGVPVSVKEEMLGYYIRLLSLLRWRAELLRPTDHWYATFIRYVELVADKVRALGGNPDRVPPTPDGDVPLPGKGDDDGDDGNSDGDGDGGFFEPGDDDLLGETDGLPPVGQAKPGVWSGKVSGLLFDHFGDFEGFTLEAYSGDHRRFFSREQAILALAETAWSERRVVTVITVSSSSRRVRRLLIRGYS